MEFIKDIILKIKIKIFNKSLRNFSDKTSRYIGIRNYCYDDCGFIKKN